MARLEGKVAIVSGGASGMGAEEARLFAREGAKVVLTDVIEDDGRKVEAQIQETSGEAAFISADVTQEGDWARVIEGTLSRFGKLDILVNNAGIGTGAFPDPADTDGWHRIMAVNATGVFLGTKHAIPEMIKAGGGSIVNISSIMGFIGDDFQHPAYNASKGAVRIFTKATAVRYGPDGIRANSVHPGFMPVMRTSDPDLGMREKLISQAPLRRSGEVHEVANRVLFLASDDASYITGTELVIDGGYIAR